VAEAEAVVAEIVALHDKYVESFDEGYDPAADVKDYVYYNVLALMRDQTLKDVDNYFYDAQMAKMDAAIRSKVAENVESIKAKLPAEYTVYDIYAEVANILGDSENNVHDFVKAIASEVTHSAEGKFSTEDDILAYYAYLLFTSFEGYDLSEKPTLSVEGGATKVNNALKILDNDFEDRLPLLLAQAKANTKRGFLPNYNLRAMFTAEEYEALGNELVSALIKAKFADESQRDTLRPEALRYLEYCYYTEVLELLSADELPKFHVSEIYAGTLNEAAMGLKELMYFFVTAYSDLTEDQIDALIKTGGGLKDDGEEEDEASRYLSDDGRIVSVTYGTKNADGSYSAYKTFILNYNNFSVNVEYGDVTYTIPAYGYVVVMH
jgi:hypothetical protein